MKKLIFSLMASTSLFAAPHAIVFDYGGVMTTEPNREMVVQFLRTSFQLSESEFQTVNEEKRRALKTGKTDAEFWLNYAKEKKIALPDNWEKSFKGVLKTSIGMNLEMYALVDQLKEKKIPVALLSNIDERLAKLLKDFGSYEPFDPCILSYEIGVQKPDPKAYEAILKKLDLPAEKVVFIDDLAENVEAAKKLGFDAIQFESTEQIRQELARRELL